MSIDVQEAYTLTIYGLKQAAKGRKLLVYTRWGDGERSWDYMPVSRAAFFRSIGIRSENQHVEYTVSGRYVFIGKRV